MAALPRITLVTPSYNQARYLEQPIRSVLLQGYRNLEYIVMDGGSSDGSVDILRRYESELTHWESHADDGQADAIQRGFAIGTGELLGWLNSDDLLMPGCLRAVAESAEHDKDSLAIGGRLVLIDERGRLTGVSVPCRRRNWKHMLLLGHGLGQMATFWKRSAYEQVGGLDTSLAFSFDYDLFVRLRQCGSIRLINRYLACFRMYPRQKTATISKIGWQENQFTRQKYGMTSFGRLAELSRRMRPIRRARNAIAWFRDRHDLQQDYQAWVDACRASLAPS